MDPLQRVFTSFVKYREMWILFSAPPRLPCKLDVLMVLATCSQKLGTAVLHSQGDLNIAWPLINFAILAAKRPSNGRKKGGKNHSHNIWHFILKDSTCVVTSSLRFRSSANLFTITCIGLQYVIKKNDKSPDRSYRSERGFVLRPCNNLGGKK